MKARDSHMLRYTHRTFLLASAVSLVVLVGGRPADGQWPQWGGPNRNFSIAVTGLADSWPEKGPKELWKRKLGEGFSGIVYDDGVIYTMYRKRTAPIEYTIAFDAKTGEKIWEREHASPVPESAERWPGPHSTPLVSGDHLFSVGRNAVLRCYDKKAGTVVWKRDLVQDYGASFSEWGYSPSPVAYKDLIILPVSRRRPDFGHQPASGGSAPDSAAIDAAEGRTLMAFNARDGELAWKSQDFGIDHSSPILIDVEGEEQIVMVTPEAVFGVEPASGELAWSETFSQAEGFMVTPVWMGNKHLFFSTPNGGSRVLSLARKDGEVVHDEFWRSRKLRMSFSNPIQVGDYIVGSSGQQTSILVCLNKHTGKRVWAERNFGFATLVASGDKVIVLEENGRLSLVTMTPKGPTVHSQCKIAEPECFTTPTLVGMTLYVRNRQEIMALDLS